MAFHPDRLHLARRTAAWLQGEQRRLAALPERFAVLSRHQRWLPVLAHALESRGLPAGAFPLALLFRNAFAQELVSRLSLPDRGARGALALRELLDHPGTPLSAVFRARFESLGELFALPAARLPVEQRGPWHAFTRSLAQWLRLARDPSTPLGRAAAFYARELGAKFFWPHEHQADKPSVFAAAFLRFAPPSWTTGEFLRQYETGGGEEPNIGEPPRRGGVALLTMHAAKGKEFVGVACYRFGELDRDTPADLEEEHRLRYVAMTRAERSLLLTSDRPDSPALREALLNPRWRRFGEKDLFTRLRWARSRRRPEEALRLRDELKWRKTVGEEAADGVLTPGLRPSAESPRRLDRG